MKTYVTLLAIGSLAAFQATAALRVKDYPASEMTVEGKIQVFTPLTTPTHTMTDKNKIWRHGNMSSQPWVQISDWHPGAAQFPDPGTQGPKLDVIWVGHEPWR